LNATPSLRARLYAWLEPDATGSGRLTWVSAVLVGLVILSFISLALETEPALPDWAKSAVSLANTLIVVLFAAEYGLRLWAAGENPAYGGLGGRIKYAMTPLALADLAAFAPELLLTLFAPEEGGALLAALRALRLFRLFKLARYVPAFSIVGAALRRAGPPLLAALAVAAVQVYVAALILYFIEGQIEGQQEEFGSVTRALWWAVVTLTTVGYGDVYPITPLGRFAAALIALAGIGIVAMPTGIIASSFAEEFRERHEAKLRAAVARVSSTPRADQSSPSSSNGPPSSA
jgi:voltage-gated potassium channel